MNREVHDIASQATRCLINSLADGIRKQSVETFTIRSVIHLVNGMKPILPDILELDCGHQSDVIKYADALLSQIINCLSYYNENEVYTKKWVSKYIRAFSNITPSSIYR